MMLWAMVYVVVALGLYFAALKGYEQNHGRSFHELLDDWPVWAHLVLAGWILAWPVTIPFAFLWAWWRNEL